MALDYTLHLSTSVKPRQAWERLAGRIAGLAWSEDDSCLFDETVTITAMDSRALTRSVIEESFQFVPNLWVGFRCAKFADQDTFARVLLDATLLLLEDSKEAVILFNGEFIILQRLGGQLVFNADSGLWHDEKWLKGRLTVPFARRPLSSPLL
jgi:hypothetical protein